MSKPEPVLGHMKQGKAIDVATEAGGIISRGFGPVADPYQKKEWTAWTSLTAGGDHGSGENPHELPWPMCPVCIRMT